MDCGIERRSSGGDEGSIGDLQMELRPEMYATTREEQSQILQSRQEAVCILSSSCFEPGEEEDEGGIHDQSHGLELLGSKYYQILI